MNEFHVLADVISTFRVTDVLPIRQVVNPEDLFKRGYVGESKRPKREQASASAGPSGASACVSGGVSGHANSRRSRGEGRIFDAPEQVTRGNLWQMTSRVQALRGLTTRDDLINFQTKFYQGHISAEPLGSRSPGRLPTPEMGGTPETPPPETLIRGKAANPRNQRTSGEA